MFVLIIKVGIFYHVYYFKVIYILFFLLIIFFFNFFKFGFLFKVCASIHLIYGLVLTTCIGIFHVYYEVLIYTFQFDIFFLDS